MNFGVQLRSNFSRFGIFVVISVIAGCEKGEVSAPISHLTNREVIELPGLGKPEKLVLYSISPETSDDSKKSEEMLHSHLVLGKIEITDSAQRAEIIQTLKDGINRAPPASAACFDPRHAIRVFENGKSVDYLICFHCSNVKIHQEKTEEYHWTGVRQDFLQPVLNRHLKAAGIALAD